MKIYQRPSPVGALPVIRQVPVWHNRALLADYSTCLKNEREARVKRHRIEVTLLTPEATFISLSLGTSSAWLRRLASRLRMNLNEFQRM